MIDYQTDEYIKSINQSQSFYVNYHSNNKTSLNGSVFKTNDFRNSSNNSNMSIRKFHDLLLIAVHEFIYDFNALPFLNKRDLLLKDYLIKSTKTQTQTKKNIFQRAKKQSEFIVNPKYHHLENLHLLLVDDVMTTGATLQNAGNCIIKNSTHKISILTMAYTR